MTWKVIWMWNWVCPRLNSVQNGVWGRGTMVTRKKFYQSRCLSLIGVLYPRPIMCKEWMVFNFIVGRFSVARYILGLLSLNPGHSLRASTSVGGNSCIIEKTSIFTHFVSKLHYISASKVLYNHVYLSKSYSNREYIHGYCSSCIQYFNNFLFAPFFLSLLHLHN